MLRVLQHPVYRNLFSAQIIALLGTGLATVALGLLAFELAGDQAGTVLGTALAIKMIAYVTVSPIASALTETFPRRFILVSLDCVRAAIVFFLPFVTTVLQIYFLIFLLHATSAAFTPTFQATIPDILKEEDDYTNALALSRFAYDMESLISPMLAAFLLLLIPFQALFAGTVIGFLASACLIISVILPKTEVIQKKDFYERITRGIRIYLATPRLRGLLAICFVVSSAGAMVFVNTVVLVQGTFKLDQQNTALALASFGSGSMIAALFLPKILDKYSDRAVMLAGAILLSIGLILCAFLQNYKTLLVLWFIFGIGYSVAQTPSGRLLRRSSHPEDRPALFAAHFALSHACWLISYPLAGWLGASIGLSATSFALAICATGGACIAFYVWPLKEQENLMHTHTDLPPEDPHWKQGHTGSERTHSHPFVIDHLHRQWPGEI